MKLIAITHFADNYYTCNAKDNQKCIFPIQIDGKEFYSCVDMPRNNLPNGTLWCPINNFLEDETYKTVAICRNNCPGG